MHNSKFRLREIWVRQSDGAGLGQVKTSARSYLRPSNVVSVAKNDQLDNPVAMGCEVKGVY
jgi:hypothetical protein